MSHYWVLLHMTMTQDCPGGILHQGHYCPSSNLVEMRVIFGLMQLGDQALSHVTATFPSRTLSHHLLSQQLSRSTWGRVTVWSPGRNAGVLTTAGPLCLQHNSYGLHPHPQNSVLIETILSENHDFIIESQKAWICKSPENRAGLLPDCAQDTTTLLWALVFTLPSATIGEFHIMQ